MLKLQEYNKLLKENYQYIQEISQNNKSQIYVEANQITQKLNLDDHKLPHKIRSIHHSKKTGKKISELTQPAN